MTTPDTQKIDRSPSKMRTWPEWFTIMLRVGGASGVIVSMLAFIVLPVYAPTVIRTLQESTSSTAGQVEELAAALDLASGALRKTAKTLGDVSGAFSTTNLFIEDSVALLQTFGTVLGGKAPNTIESTQEALESAQEGARAIDSTMRALSAIEFLTGISYDPENSISASLERVAQSLKPLPDALREVRQEMNNSALSLDDLRPQFTRVADDLNSFAENASTVAQELNTRGEALEELAQQINDFSTKISTVIWVVTAGLMVFFVGMAIGQSAVYALGTSLRDENKLLS